MADLFFYVDETNNAFRRALDTEHAATLEVERRLAASVLERDQLRATLSTVSDERSSLLRQVDIQKNHIASLQRRVADLERKPVQPYCFCLNVDYPDDCICQGR